MSERVSRQPAEFMAAAAARGIEKWTINECGGCGYPCGFLFAGGCVSYDHGCGCVPYHDVRPTDWAEVAGHYNLQRSDETRARMDAFWGFGDPGKDVSR